jgi:hypothetical protein
MSRLEENQQGMCAELEGEGICQQVRLEPAKNDLMPYPLDLGGPPQPLRRLFYPCYPKTQSGIPGKDVALRVCVSTSPSDADNPCLLLMQTHENMARSLVTSMPSFLAVIVLWAEIKHQILWIMEGSIPSFSPRPLSPLEDTTISIKIFVVGLVFIISR